MSVRKTDPPARADAEIHRKYHAFWWKLMFEVGALVLLALYFVSMSD
jgi:hypothetical protein